MLPPNTTTEGRVNTLGASDPERMLRLGDVDCALLRLQSILGNDVSTMHYIAQIQATESQRDKVPDRIEESIEAIIADGFVQVDGGTNRDVSLSHVFWLLRNPGALQVLRDGIRCRGGLIWCEERENASSDSGPLQQILDHKNDLSESSDLIGFAQSANTVPAHGFRKRGRFRAWSRAVLTAVCIIVSLGIGMGAHWGTVQYFEWRNAQEMLEKFKIEQRLQFAFADKDHPSLDPEKARAIIVIGADVYIKVRAAGHIYSRLRVWSDAPLPGHPYGKIGEPILILDQAIGTDKTRVNWVDVEEKLFSSPGDGKERRLTVRFDSWDDESVQAVAFINKQEKYDQFVRTVICLKDRPQIAASLRPPVIKTITPDPDNPNGVKVVVTPNTHRGVIVIASSQGTEFIPASLEIPVSTYGEDVEVTVQLSGPGSYQLRPCALVEGNPGVLSNAIKQKKTDNVVGLYVGRAKRYTHPRK